MDECCGGAAPVPVLGRREFLRRSSAVALAIPLLPVFAGSATARTASRSLDLRDLTVRPREDWAQGLPPKGPLEQERPEDVRFLLVHHSASANNYGRNDVPGLIRSFYAAHTGPGKNWADVAYNFFVDRYGGLWEGRAGSLAGPIKPDATGGSQGFAQLCCFIGDHQTEPPTDEARHSVIALLAALAAAYGIDTSPGATTSFVSRGSNRWPRGSSVTVATIAGHRDMSQTVCPGDAAYELVQNVFPREVSAARAARFAAPPNGQAASEPSPTEPAPTAAQPPAQDLAAPVESDRDGRVWSSPLAVVTGSAVAAGAVGLAAMIMRRRRRASRAAPSTGSSVPAGQFRAESRVPGQTPSDAVVPTIWEVLDGSSVTGPAPVQPEPDGPERAAGIHERYEHILLGSIVQSTRPSSGVRAALDSCRQGASDIDRRPEVWVQDPTRVAATLVSQALNAGYAADGCAGPDLDIAVFMVMDGTCALVATDELMGAILTTSGTTYRPRFGRARTPGDRYLLRKTHCREDEVSAAAITSLAPANSPTSSDQAARLTALCHQVLVSPDVRRVLANYQYEYFGSTGAEAALITFLHRVAATDPPKPDGPSSSRWARLRYT